MRIAIITGASSGLGRCFACEADRRGQVDEIWAVARRADRLQDLAAKLCTPVRVLPVDLAAPGGVEQLAALLQAEQPDVRLLVNAAGLGKFGNYDDLTQAENDQMLNVNVRALVNLTNATLPYMDKGARLFQIASCAGYQPLPGLNVYAATKAFVLRYTRGLRWELAGRGIRVTAVCPGWIKTEFMQVAQDTQDGQTVQHFLLATRPETVVCAAFAANELGLAVASCTPVTMVQRLFCKLSPDWLSMGAWTLLR